MAKIIEEIAPPHMGKVLFTLGDRCNENAIRIAKEYTGRTKVFSQYYSYHGATYGACNLNGEAARGSVEPQSLALLSLASPEIILSRSLKQTKNIRSFC